MRWKMGFSAAKILPCPPYMPLGTIEIREGFGPLELSKVFSTVCNADTPVFAGVSALFMGYFLEETQLLILDPGTEGAGCFPMNVLRQFPAEGGERAGAGEN